MVLTFTELADLRADGQLIQMGHEPNNELIQYFRKNDRIQNDMAEPNKGNYTGLVFDPITNRVPTKPYTLFGIKTFPKMGAYGWFRTKYEHITHILVPLVSPQVRYAPPTFTFTQTSTTVQITIVPPGSVEYDCYRILFRNGYFATEYITYDTFADVPKPATGEYELYIIGYRSTGEISEETPRQAIAVSNPTPEPGEVVESIAIPSAPSMQGNIILEAGDNVSLTQDTVNKKITINASGGGGSTYYENPIDQPPSVPSIYDDEFSDDTMDPKWSWIYQNSATWNETRGRGYISVPAQADSMRILAQVAPGGNYTVVAKIRNLSPRMNYSQFGIAIYNSGNNRRYSFGVGTRGAIAADQWIRFTGDTAYSTDTWTGGLNAASLYVRIVVADGSFSAQTSQDGTIWVNLYGPETISSWIGAITHIGFGFFRNNTANNVPWVGCAEWFRVFTT